ncbi:hypothetical protein F4778DRAFT_677275 [Xylariomycetidae sp. FL2044]|nr:hypothetical protein F4778DRAFT_677275 [Xylariomycetidae sp. FL2044]
MLFSQFSIAAVLSLASLGLATEEQPATTPVLGTDTVHGCYGSLGELEHDSDNEFNTQGKCTEICRNQSKLVAATNAKACYCGDKYPNSNDLVDDDQCTEPCPGFSDQACGGLDTYTVYNTGVKVSVGESEEQSSSTTSAASSTATTAASTAPATSDTVTTPSASATPTDSADKGSSTNVAGIAAGVVVGVVAIAGIAGGAFFFVRRRRNAEIEEEHRRNAAVNAFISGGGKPPGSSGGLSMADSRLDPVMNRRMSDGSIADNQDYSRRILRVCNPDRTSAGYAV